jgi:hypothetical protein
MKIHDATGVIGGVEQSSDGDLFATLSPEYIRRAAREPAVSVRKRWDVNSNNIYFIDTENFALWLVPEPGGWIIMRALGSPSSFDLQTLCNILGDMPILCSRWEVAAQLAEACHPTPLAVLQWRADHSHVNRASQPPDKPLYHG